MCRRGGTRPSSVVLIPSDFIPLRELDFSTADSTPLGEVLLAIASRLPALMEIE